jgi:hypothetical protein
MDQETTHTRISSKSATMLNALSEKTGIPRTKLLDGIIAEVLAAIDSNEPVAELGMITKLRILNGKPPRTDPVSERLVILEARVNEISQGNYGKQKK